MWVRAGFQFEVVPLPRDLSSLPLLRGDWLGTDVVTADEGIIELLNAQSTIEREHWDALGRAVQLTISAWLNPDTVADAAPHLPKLCYQNAGWSILEEQDIRQTSAAGELPLTVLLMERGEERIVAAYWYQMGRRHFTTVAQARRVHRELWGPPRWCLPASAESWWESPRFGGG